MYSHVCVFVWEIIITARNTQFKIELCNCFICKLNISVACHPAAYLNVTTYAYIYIYICLYIIFYMHKLNMYETYVWQPHFRNFKLINTRTDTNTSTHIRTHAQLVHFRSFCQPFLVLNLQ